MWTVKALTHDISDASVVLQEVRTCLTMAIHKNKVEQSFVACIDSMPPGCI